MVTHFSKYFFHQGRPNPVLVFFCITGHFFLVSLSNSYTLLWPLNGKILQGSDLHLLFCLFLFLWVDNTNPKGRKEQRSQWGEPEIRIESGHGSQGERGQRWPAENRCKAGQGQGLGVGRGVESWTGKVDSAKDDKFRDSGKRGQLLVKLSGNWTIKGGHRARAEGLSPPPQHRAF